MSTRPITPQDWKDIEEKLRGFYAQVKLMCDGYELTLQLQRMSQFKNVITFYVNGIVAGKWYLDDCEERRRFFQPKKRAFHSKNELVEFGKISKRFMKEMAAKNIYIYHAAEWNSFRSLKSHLIKNNKNIEIMTD